MKIQTTCKLCFKENCNGDCQQEMVLVGKAAQEEWLKSNNDQVVNGGPVIKDFLKDHLAKLNDMGRTADLGYVTFDEFFKGFENRYTEDQFYLMKWCWNLAVKKGRP